MEHTYIRHRKDCVEWITFDDAKMTVHITASSNWNSNVTNVEKPVSEYLRELINETQQKKTVYP